MRRTLRRYLLLLALSPVVATAPTRGDDSQQLAGPILRDAGVHGGLVVHLGCGDGKLTASLRQNDRCLVHGLDSDTAHVASAREHLLKLGVYGRVSADTFDGRRLPYVDNLVNLLVAEDLGQVAVDEVVRVLAPRGVALISGAGGQGSGTGGKKIEIAGRTWTKIVKPWPEEMDEWTHWLHDASGNAVGQDLVVGPPRHYQWTASPSWSSHHDTVLTTSAMVTAAGRIFAIVNETPVSEFHDRSQGKWFLVARDAFNGILLWRLPIKDWGWQAWGESFTKRFAQPVQLPSRLVAQGDRVHVTLGFRAPVTAVDAATGQVLKTYENTRSADEILLHDGKLIVTVYDPEGERAKKTIRAVDPDSGEVMWESGPYVGLPARYDALEGWDPLYVTAHQNRVVLVSKQHVVCLDLNSGHQRWRVPRPAYHEHKMNLGVRESENCSLVNHQNVVLYTQPAGRLPHTNHTVPCDLYALSADTGETLWKRKCGVWAWGHQADVFVIRDLVWVHEHIPTKMEGPSPVDLESLDHALLGLDIDTGRINRRIPATDIFRIGHHHRCYRNKATTKYVFTARRGTELTDLDSGRIRLHPWVRSECRFGIIPANGLLYTAPHPCACYAGVSLTGYNALAAARHRQPEAGHKRDQAQRIEHGPAYGKTSTLPSTFGPPASDEWPTYRQNGGRSGFIPVRIARELQTDWRCRLSAPLSAPTVSEGRVYVAEQQRHTVVALDARSGRILWRFIAGGRVDSPPTAVHGRVVFGAADGWVYCLRAADAVLIWRFRAAPNDLRMVADNGLESVWPVHGSLLVEGGVVVAMAGRSSYLDGGLHAYRLDLTTGQIIDQRQISHEHLTDKKALASQAVRYDHYYTDGSVTDVLVSQGSSVFLKATAIFGDGVQRDPLLASHSGFLDDSFFERAFWFLVRPGQEPIGAQLIVHDASTAFGFRAYPSPQRGGPWHVLGTGYTLFAAACSTPRRRPADRSPDPRHVPGFTEKLSRSFTWRQNVPVRAQAMVLTKNALLVAGSPDVVKPGTDPYAAVQGKLGGKLLWISRADGKTLAEYELDSPPVFDGLAAAAGRLFLSAMDGRVICLTENRQTDRGAR